MTNTVNIYDIQVCDDCGRIIRDIYRCPQRCRYQNHPDYVGERPFTHTGKDGERKVAFLDNAPLMRQTQVVELPQAQDEIARLRTALKNWRSGRWESERSQNIRHERDELAQKLLEAEDEMKQLRKARDGAIAALNAAKLKLEIATPHPCPTCGSDTPEEVIVRKGSNKGLYRRWQPFTWHSSYCPDPFHKDIR